jgi:carbon-monoxide dehydrogenase iron sulfur subunit
MTVCPTAAISRDADSGIVDIDGDKCITCAMCAMVCPFDVLTFYPLAPGKPDKAVAVKCDHCVDRQLRGELPACVEACKVGALVFGDINELVKDSSLHFARSVSVAVGEMRPEMTRLPANIEAWRTLGQNTTGIGRE